MCPRGVESSTELLKAVGHLRIYATEFTGERSLDCLEEKLVCLLPHSKSHPIAVTEEYLVSSVSSLFGIYFNVIMLTREFARISTIVRKNTPDLLLLVVTGVRTAFLHFVAIVHFIAYYLDVQMPQIEDQTKNFHFTGIWTWSMTTIIGIWNSFFGPKSFTRAIRLQSRADADVVVDHYLNWKALFGHYILYDSVATFGDNPD